VKHWIIAILIFSLFIACGHKKPELIPKKQLIEMMVDLNISDALSLNSYIVSQLGGIDSTAIYSTFFAKHKYTKEDFDYTMEYYSAKPKKLTAIYDEVFAELSKRSDELRDMSEKFSYSGLKNIWSVTKPVHISGDSINYPDTYDIKTDSTGIFVITAQIKMTEDDQSLNPCITAYYYNPQIADRKNRHYFKRTQIIKSAFFREYQVYEKNDNPTYTQLHIILPDRDNKDTLFNKSFDLTSITVGILKEDLDKNNKK
jgi:hypothetical protein